MKQVVLVYGDGAPQMSVGCTDDATLFATGIDVCRVPRESAMISWIDSPYTESVSFKSAICSPSKTSVSLAS